jgi:hypothetical protein
VRALAAALAIEPRELTSPEEVAELRRVLKSNARASAQQSISPTADSV